MFVPSMEELILSGAVEVSGIDNESGEFLYSFTEKLQEVMPDLFANKVAFIQEQLMYFFEVGMVDIQNPLSPNPIFALTELAFDKDLVKNLPPEKQKSLEEIKKIFER
jgi:hypothetical protein